MVGAVSLRPIRRTKTASPKGPIAAWRSEWGTCAYPAGQHKRSYPSRHEAIKDARTIGGTAYKCRLPGCRAYHITRYPPRVNKAIKLLLESLREDVHLGRVSRETLTRIKAEMEAAS